VLQLNTWIGEHAHRPSRRLGACLLAALLGGIASLPAIAQPFPANMCAADRNRVDLGCTANDIDIATVTVNNGVTSCVAGTSVTLDLTVNLQSNARDRNDIGIFIALDGR